MSDATPAAQGRLHLRVTDENSAAIPFRAEWRTLGAVGEPWRRQWSDSGEAVIEAPAGRLSLLVRRGIHYDAVALEISIDAGSVRRQAVTLRRRFDPRAMGWWGGENHMHVLHGPKDPPATFADGARMAAGDGLDYLQLAYGWDEKMDWPSAEELNRRARQVSNAHVIVGWNIESPKSYLGEDDGGRTHNVHCLGHGWTMGLKDNSPGPDFFHGKPNFRILQEVRRQGGIVGVAHPVRYWFSDSGHYVSNWAGELPFDFVAGVPYAAVDILNDSPLLFFESEQMWYTLLNLGYKVSGTGNTDGAIGTTRAVGRFRTYAKIEGEFSWDKLTAAIRDGRVMATSGPFVFFTVDGEDSGAEFVADGRPRRAVVRAWSSPLPGEILVAVQLVRNGQIIRAWDLRELRAREWQVELDLADREFAWYAVRVLSTCRDPQSVDLWGDNVCELAVANPVYFLPTGFERPMPQLAQVVLRVTDSAGHPLDADVIVRDDNKTLQTLSLAAGSVDALSMPATASLVISAPGFAPAERNLFMDCPELLDYCRNMGSVWPSIYSPETYMEIRRRLANLRLTVVLQRSN